MQQYAPPKRPRTDHVSYSDDIVVTNSRHTTHPPPYPQPPHTYPIATTTAEGLPPRPTNTLLEDWKHLEMVNLIEVTLGISKVKLI